MMVARACMHNVVCCTLLRGVQGDTGKMESARGDVVRSVLRAVDALCKIPDARTVRRWVPTGTGRSPWLSVVAASC